MPFNMQHNTIEELIEQGESLTIPPHQRNYVWDLNRASKFIRTILEDLPTHALVIRKAFVDAEQKIQIEDGHQRWTTVKKFMDNQISVDNRTYSDLTPQEVHKFLRQKFAITEVRDMTDSQIEDLFQRLQDGKPLTNGQRFHARNHPIVNLAKRLMKDRDCEAVWGNKTDTATKMFLANTVAIASGLAWGKPDLITNSYDIISREMTKPESYHMNETLIQACLEKLLSVYHAADERFIVNATQRRKQWNPGMYSAQILQTMLQTDRDWEEDKQLWIDQIVEVRRNPNMQGILKDSIPKSRNWNEARWKAGLERVERFRELAENYTDGDYSLSEEDE